MAENKVLRLVVDPSGGVAGMKKFSASAAGAQAASNRLALAVGAIGGAMLAYGAGRGIASAVRSHIALDSAMTQSLAIMGDVDHIMRERMTESARQVARELNFTAEQGAEAYFFLASAGLDAEQSIAALPAVAQFARAGMFDLATATDLATDAQSALGLTVADSQENLRNMTRVTDVLVKANTLANASVEQFATSLTTEAAAAMKTFNMDVEEGMAVLAAFADQGIKGQRAGSGFSRILRLMSSAIVNNKEEMAALGVELTDSESNLKNMADVVQELEVALDGMNDEQRTAALESIGFTARVQGMILPLLGTSEAIREYEEGLRDAGNITEEVTNSQMESLENRLGQLQQGFAEWRRDLTDGMVPALIWAIDHVDLLTDSVVGLTVAVGVGGAVVAFGSLAAAITPAAATISVLVGNFGLATAAMAVFRAGLQRLLMFLGPKGWVVLGVSTLAGVLAGRLRSSMREAAQDAEEYAERLDLVVGSIGALNEEAAGNVLAGLSAQIHASGMEIQEIQERLEEARNAPSGGLGVGSAKEIAEIQGELEKAEESHAELVRLAEAASERWHSIREEAEAAGDAPPPGSGGPDPEEILDAMRERIGLLTEALELEIEGYDVIEETFDIRDAIRGALEADNLTLDRRVGLMQDELALTEAIREAALKRAGDPEDGLVNSDGVPGGASDTGSMVDSTRRSAQILMSTGRQVAQDTAASFEMNWTAAISQIGASLGGLASQAANVATAFLTGGPAAGIPALGGMIGSMISGSPSATQDEYNRALADFAALGEEASRVQQRLNVNYEGAASTIVTGLEAITGASIDVHGELPRTAAELELFVERIAWMLEQMGYSASEMEAVIAEVTAEMEANIEDMRDSFRESIELRLLEARGMDEEADAIRRNIDRQEELAEAMELGGLALVGMLTQLYKLEDASRAAADAEAERRERIEGIRQARQDELTLEARRASLSGDPLGALRARLQSQAEAELNALQDRLDAGEISEQYFHDMADVIHGEVNQALAEFTRQAREAARAERERQLAMEERLRLELLRLTGQDAAALALEQEMRMNDLLADNATAAALAILDQIQAEERRQFAMQESSQAADDAARSMERFNASISGPQGFNWDFLALRSAQEVGVVGRNRIAPGAASSQTTNRIERVIIMSSGNETPRELYEKFRVGMIEAAEDGDTTGLDSLEFG